MYDMFSAGNTGVSNGYSEMTGNLLLHPITSVPFSIKASKSDNFCIQYSVLSPEG